jgi:hypothetical protein
MVKPFPIWYTDFEAVVHLHFALVNIEIDILGSPHHGEEAFVHFWRVYILLCICISMVHPVHHPVAVRTQIRRALADVRENIKEPLPEFGHVKHLVGGVAVVEKGLTEQR